MARNPLVYLIVCLALGFCLWIPLVAIAEEENPIRVEPTVVDSRDFRIGERISDLSFVDTKGQKGRLSDYSGNKVTVIAIHAIGCPLCKKYTPKLESLQKEYLERGVAFLLVNLDDGEKKSNIEEFLKKYEVDTCRYIHDPKGTFGRELRVVSTTDVFVLDASRTLRYRGAVDDQYGLGFNRSEPRSRYLRDAIDAVLANQRPAVQATSAPGCALEFELEPPEQAQSKVTYHNRVSRILQQNCQESHRPGEVGPFPLLDYADAKQRKGMIQYVVKNRTMPPWFAEGTTHEWSNDRSLAERDRKDLLTWIESGCPEGDPKDAVTALAWTEGWQIGEPDLILQVPKIFNVPAEGAVPYQYTKIRVPIEEDRWVQSMEIRPTGKEVVHHVLVLIKYPRRHSKDLVQPDFMDGIGGYFAVMVPGQGATEFPEGMGKFLPRGSTLIFQMHYTPIGVAATDQTRIALQFAESEPELEVKTKGIANLTFAIPPGAPNHQVAARHRFEEDSRILSFFPHMHLRGKAFRYELLYPDGREEVVLDVPRYDFNWQLSYRLQDPLDVPGGTILKVTGWFDNSEQNPANPDPTDTVHFGEQTWEEMLIGYFDWHPIAGG